MHDKQKVPNIYKNYGFGTPPPIPKAAIRELVATIAFLKATFLGSGGASF